LVRGGVVPAGARFGLVMSMHVRISDPALLTALVDSLLEHGCIAHTVAEDRCLVVHVNARHAEEASREVAFYVRAWQLGHPNVSADVILF
jgi:hypothetical protein